MRLAGFILLILIVVALGVAWNGPKFMATVRRARQSQFSVKDLLVTTTVIAVLLGLVAWASR
jgi:hypothetical protein